MASSKSYERQRAILEATIGILAELGYEQCTFDAIAARLAISKSVIAYHFKNKESLLRKIVEYLYAKGEAYMTPTILTARQESATAMLRAYITSNMQFISESHVSIVALLEIMHSGSLAGSEQHKMADGTIAPLGMIFAYGQQRGEFRTFNPTAMAIALRGAIDAVGSRLRVDPSFDITQYGKELVDTFERACNKTGR